ncbi:MAG TPA: shikimate kinase [Lachnospiraceae bacterium]|nr:shikimate kinase [Lachnospiraceae bacterium]
MNHIIIEGFMGSGKSAAGKLLSKEMKLPLIDIDKVITEKMKMTSGEIYERFGEPYYRAMETYVLAGLSGQPKRSVVILGSGLVLMPQNEAYLKELGTVYFLKVKQATIVERLEQSDRHPWMKTGDLGEHVARMLKEREPAYKKAANQIIKTDGKSVEDIVKEIIELDAGAAGTSDAAEQEVKAPETKKAKKTSKTAVEKKEKPEE